MKFLEKAYAAPLLTFALTLAAYLSTLAPDVTFTDSGELAAVAATLGVAHPTGYPLFTLLGHLWTLLPLPGTVIYRMNLFANIAMRSSKQSEETMKALLIQGGIRTSLFNRYYDF